MCGIVGFQGAFDASLLQAMADAVAHRGPDGQACAVLGGALPTASGLGHRRLSIIDLSSQGSQPMAACCSACGATSLEDLALTFNGEIYNFRELRSELEARGHTFRSHTDSEVLLHLYAEHGVEMLRYLNGIFAFAIFDGRERGRPTGIQRGDLFIARDQLGIKPLYHCATRSGFLFASEIKALLQCPEVPRDIDHIALHYHLAYLWTPAPRTMLHAVRKLEPGCAMVVRGGTVQRHWRYYELPYAQPSASGSADDIAAQVRELVAKAVDRQMVADVPVGAFLSGGLDSSAVVAMMRRARPDAAPTCYCIGFESENGLDGTPADLPFARRVADHLGVQLHEIIIDPGIISQLDRMLYALDEPQADPAPINAMLIAEQARKDGIKVLLSGAGGDDIFSGYRRHEILRMEPLWRATPRPARRLFAAAARRSAAGGGLHLHNRIFRRAVTMFEHSDLTPDERLISHFWWSGEALRRSLYSPGLADATANEQTAAPLLASLERIPGERSPLNRALYLEAKHFLADHNLNYTDKVAMATGVEVRVPLLDLELVDFAARIPPQLKLRGGIAKWIFKRAMEPVLPHDVIYRPKTGFGAPLREWLRRELRDDVEELLSPAALRRRGLFDPAAVRRLIDLDRAGRVDGAYTIFALLCFERWCRLFVDPCTVACDSVH
jgi:asparagine synthase (glutamine-hydrolysing)